MEKVLIDSGVILDFFFDRAPHSEYSAQLLNLCAIKKTNGFVTPLIIANVYYLLRKTAKQKQVIDKLNRLLNFIDIIEMNREIVIKALNSGFKDFEDALQNFSAEHSQEIDIIITRNLKDYKNSSLVVMSPETYVKGKNKL